MLKNEKEINWEEIPGFSGKLAVRLYNDVVNVSSLAGLTCRFPKFEAVVTNCL